jgi:hypothetical protein
MSNFDRVMIAILFITTWLCSEFNHFHIVELLEALTASGS